MKRIWLMVSMAVFAGCSVDPAPTGVEEIARWTWANYEAADDEAVADAIVKLHAELKDMPVDDSLEGSVDARLTREELEPVGLHEKNDPSKARGLLVATVIECPLAKVEPLIWALNQDELHPGTYDTYKREHTSSLDAFTSRQAPLLTWTTDLEATSPFGNTYNSRLFGGARWVPESPHGPVLLSRTVLPEPAKFEDDDAYFRQDYQIELFYERAPGETVHVFAVWREMKVDGLDSEGDTLVSFQMSSFVQWDERLEKLCQAK